MLLIDPENEIRVSELNSVKFVNKPPAHNDLRRGEYPIGEYPIGEYPIEENHSVLLAASAV